MSPEQRHAYDYYLDTMVRDEDVLRTKLLEARIEGEKQGRKEGLEKGRAEGIEKGRAEGIEKGRAEGIEKGRAEGHANANRENARRMKLDGMPTELIAKYTLLSIDDINAL
jgi:predicted transposase YdaD